MESRHLGGATRHPAPRTANWQHWPLATFPHWQHSPSPSRGRGRACRGRNGRAVAVMRERNGDFEDNGDIGDLSRSTLTSPSSPSSPKSPFPAPPEREKRPLINHQQTTNKPTNQLTNKPTNQQTNQPTNQLPLPENFFMLVPSAARGNLVYWERHVEATGGLSVTFRRP